MALLQIIFKILRDALMQVHTLMTAHIVRLSRINEEVGLGTFFDALGYEGEAMLRHYCVVIVARYDLQLAFKVFRLVQ